MPEGVSAVSQVDTPGSRAQGCSRGSQAYGLAWHLLPQNRAPANDAAPAKHFRSVMTAENLVRLFEEMMDLKIQHYAQTQLKLTPEVSHLLNQKRETDRRRLDQIRTELVRFLQS